MPDLIIRPESGISNRLILQDQSGGAIVTTCETGAIYQNPSTMTDDITIDAGKSAMIVGPVDFTGTVVVNGNLSIVYLY